MWLYPDWNKVPIFVALCRGLEDQPIILSAGSNTAQRLPFRAASGAIPFCSLEILAFVLPTSEERN